MKFEVMDHSGHSTFEFDAKDDVQVTSAMAKFEALVGGEKMLAITREAGQRDYTVARQFADLKEETVFRPQMKGG